MPQPPAGNPLGWPFIELQSVDSSNNYAMAQAHEGVARHGTAYFAHEQTAGKGQPGKKWVAQKGESISLSLIIQPFFLSLANQFQLSACVSVAVHQFLSQYAGDSIKIKWPNDIYWNDRKAAGILIENIIGSVTNQFSLPADNADFPRSSANDHPSSEWKWAIAGIGININQTVFPADLPNPVSLKQITGNHFNTVELAKELCGFINRCYDRLLAEGFNDIYKLYNEALYKKNETVRLKKSNRIFETAIKGVTENGQLITHHAMEERFDFGEVEWIV